MEASLLEYKRQSSRSTQKVKASFFSCFNPKNTLFRFRIAKRMEDVSDRLDAIASERMKFHLREVVEERHLQKAESLRTLMLSRHVPFRIEARKFPCHLYFPSLRAFDAKSSMLTSVSFVISTSKHLRYLNLSGCSSLRHMPPNIGKLTCLRTLSIFIVGRRRGYDVDELGSLNLHGLGKLPSLTYLYLYGMDLVQYVDNESYGGELEGELEAFPNDLNNLSRLENLMLSERLSKEERRMDFSCLSGLHIEKCPKLTLPCLRSIKELIIGGCSETLLKTVSNLHTLTSLEICDNDDLASFPDGVPQNLTTLQSLTIKRFSKLQHMQSDMLIGLSSLESLSITSCHMLECFPMEICQGSYSLKSIYIEDCIKFKSLSASFGDLTALKFLQLRGCPELEAFPNGLNNLSGLKSLKLSGYTYQVDGSENLSVPHPKLTTLPEALRHLPSLQHMSILRLNYWRSLEKRPVYGPSHHSQHIHVHRLINCFTSKGGIITLAPEHELPPAASASTHESVQFRKCFLNQWDIVSFVSVVCPA
ncbi:hypothetical protein FEM48_Zijuj11G0145700 [Ziziphus jujuba var. spinosa]|uniref:Uncharacterized protein n=1 Tax=Ziziphus jujuba var. spinosa TaxID=714518 RepID=A0A978UJH9_ZIZJJ|nr:hypothetical protein FEM48_Zijuj11G0145700 [Ziziphus jujuba var. spinosa]